MESRSFVSWGRVCCTALLTLGFALLVCGQSYDDMVAKVRGGDTNVDFKAMRIAFTNTQQFTAGIDPKLKTKLSDSIKAKKPDEIAKTAQEILKTDFMNPNVHYLAARAYQMLKDEKKTQFHTSVYVGIVNSIINGGDGESTKTAYAVISEDEETAVLTALEVQRTGQEVVEEGGHKFAVVTVTDASKNTAKVYFNIDKVPAKAAEKTPQ